MILACTRIFIQIVFVSDKFGIQIQVKTLRVKKKNGYRNQRKTTLTE